MKTKTPYTKLSKAARREKASEQGLAPVEQEVMLKSKPGPLTLEGMQSELTSRIVVGFDQEVCCHIGAQPDFGGTIRTDPVREAHPPIGERLPVEDGTGSEQDGGDSHAEAVRSGSRFDCERNTGAS